jgi:hypothetical protein
MSIIKNNEPKCGYSIAVYLSLDMAWFDFIKGFFKNPPSDEEQYEDVKELLEVLKSLTEDLLFTSESDYPFEVLLWELQTETVSAENIREYIEKIDADIVIETLTVEKILRAMSRSRPYYSAERKEKGNRFRQIISFFDTQVTDAKAFKIGKIEREVYIIGIVSNEYIIGLKSISVET